MKKRHREALIAIVTVLVGYVGAITSEHSLIQAFHPSLIDLTRISDVLLSTVLCLVAFFWLNLRAARLTLIKAEKIPIAIGRELSLASDIERNLLPEIPLRKGGIR